MKFLISPAKTLDFESLVPIQNYSLPIFTKETEKINAVLKTKSAKKLTNLMSISMALAELNFERNQKRISEYNLENARQAVFAFKGDVYLGLDAYSLSLNQIEGLNSKLRILSGLYGLLKPLDLIQPYRLEMGTHLKIGKNENLYKFWGKKITNEINSELVDLEPLVNLASQEYFGAVKPNLIKSQIITPIFKDFVNGNLKVVSFHAKKARGMMVRFAIDEEIREVELLKNFNYGKYEFAENLSTQSEWVFVR